jgi:hypothetical protein
MTDQFPDQLDRLTQLKQRQRRQDETVTQIHEILLLLAQRQQQTEATLAHTVASLDRTAAQQEINTRAIAELRAILRDRYGNGQTPQ